MRSRAARMIFGAATLVAVGAAVFFLFRTEQHIAERQSTLRAFDAQARDATVALSDVRLAQQAYVAEGQGVDFWMPKAATLQESLTSTLTAMRQSPVAAGTRTALDEAAATVAEFASIDRRVREYLASGQPLMAADVIFTEGGEAAATASRQVETARLAEHQAYETAEAALRKNEAAAAAGAAVVAVIVVLLLVPQPRTELEQPGLTTLSIAPPNVQAPAATSAPRAVAPEVRTASRHATVLKAAASLATDFGRVRDAEEMTRLLGRAATLMDASGIVVLLGDATGSSLHPVLAHGYSAQALSHMPPVPRSADNAAGAAYRTGKMQIVLARPGGTAGAVVAPILAAEGCIGALSAEIQGGAEASEGVQSLATIFAAQLAMVVGEAPGAAAPQQKTAAQG